MQEGKRIVEETTVVKMHACNIHFVVSLQVSTTQVMRFEHDIVNAPFSLKVLEQY